MRGRWEIGLAAGSVAVLLLATASAGAVRGDPTDRLPLAPARHLAFDTDEGTWMSLTLSPDGRTLVFDLLGDLYAMPAAGGTAHALTRGFPFDSQPAFSPDSRWIAFTSDRSGAENLWIMRPDGTGLRQMSHTDDVTEYVSPAWSPDSASVYVSDYRPDLTAFQLWRYDLAGGAPVQITRAKTTPDQPKDTRVSALGPAPGPDARSLYYAEKTGTFDEDMTLPIWRIVRRDLDRPGVPAPSDASATDRPAPIDPAVSAPKKAPDTLATPGAPVPVVTALGSAMRPVLSPDGRTLVYATRWRGRTGLRVRDLMRGADRWLVWPVDHDDQEGLETRDTMPGSAFSRDGRFLYTTWGGHIHRVELATGAASVVPFLAHVDLDIGPSLRRDLRDDPGPVVARLVQTPHASPDGRQVVFSALAHLYVMPLRTGATPRRLTAGETPAFMPSFSPDGAQVAYITWTAKDGGAVWVAPATGNGPPRRIGEAGFFYTSPVFAPDGRSLYVLRSSNYVRMHTYMEYGATREADLVRLDLATGAARVLTHGAMGGEPQFVAGRPDRVFVNFDDGLHAAPVAGGGSGPLVVSATGPSFYFNEGRAKVDDIRISPDGRFALLQIAQQLHLIALPPSGVALGVDVDGPTVPHRKLTSVGADFFGWADGGRTILWALGSTVFTRPLADVKLDAPGPAPADGDRPQPGLDGVGMVQARVEVPRDVPHGLLLLTHAAAITEGPAGFLPDADILVRDDRIVAIGPHGSIRQPAGVTVQDLAGAYVIPGLIDTHDHWAQVRRGVLDLTDWGLRADLASGKTAGLDPSTLTIDQFAYQDLLDAGEMLGPRTYSTGTAIFSFNEFQSLRQVEDVLTRYRDFYGTRNLKEYRVGPRRVRQWFVMASDRLGMQPTTEGALDMKLDLTQVMDGYAGAEHSMTAAPFYKDVRELMARTRVSYTLTLQISHGGPPAQNHYIARDRPLADPKMNRFWPPYALEQKAGRRHWYDDSDYIFPTVAASAGTMQAAGGLLGTGSHGELPGIGLDWEIEAYATGMGPEAALKAATMGSAETIGRQGELGSLEPGKFADLVILSADPRADVARLRTSIRQVMKGGRLYDAATLDEVYPASRTLAAPWFAADSPAGAAPAAPPLEAQHP